MGINHKNGNGDDWELSTWEWEGMGLSNPFPVTALSLLMSFM